MTRYEAFSEAGKTQRADWFAGQVGVRAEAIFYSNDHRPIHVHVRYGGGEAMFEVEQGVDLRESQGLKVRELAKAEE